MRISDWSSDVCSSDLNRQAGPGVREEVRRGDPREVPRQAAGLQLLAELQLEGEPGRRHDREVPEGDRDLRLQVPVHHPGRIPRAELLDVQPRPWLRAPAEIGRATSELQSLMRISY